MATTVTIPDFNFTAFYYGQILEALINYKRTYAPELTDESQYEPTIQILRAFSLVGHLNNTTADLIANESTLPTSQLVETVRNMLRLIDYEMSPASPAQTDMLYKLSKVFTEEYQIIKQYSQAATKKQDDAPVVFFEALEALTIQPTNVFSKVFSVDNGVFVDHTVAANNQATGQQFEPWATSLVNNALYFGHESIMWNKIFMSFHEPLEESMGGVWEYRESEWRRTAPTSVAYSGTLRFDLTSLYGSVEQTGATVRVQLNSTGAIAEGTVVWNGTYNYVDTPLLGSAASTDPADYTVGADWLPVSDLVDGTNEMNENGDVEFSLPQTDDTNWIKETVNEIEAYWVRFRMIDPPVEAVSIAYVRVDTGDQYVLRLATQGKVFTQDPLGSSTGLADQSFETSKDNFVWNSEVVKVDGETWTRVTNFLGSESGDKHYRVTLGENDRATFTFGNGATGKIPPIGASNIAATYRYSSNDDGNVGANTVTIDKTGLTFVDSVTNPRQANGWQEAQGASESSLEKAKIEGPASIRTKDVALGPDDVEQLAISYESNGSSPYVRARAFEEGFGPKTVEVIVVPAGGTLATEAQLEELTLYFNGDRNAIPKIKKRIVANQEVGAVNWTPRTIDVEATVYGVVEKEAIELVLTKLLHPEALKEDGVSWLWNFGGIVPSSRISHEIFETDQSITKVVQTSPAIDVDTQLTTRELPAIGTITLTIEEPT